MRTRLKPIAVLYACAGCAAQGQVARDAGAALERQGGAELAWLGGDEAPGVLADRARSRWPVFALDGCAEGCARAWLAGAGARPERCFVLAGLTPGEAAARLAAELA